MEDCKSVATPLEPGKIFTKVYEDGKVADILTKELPKAKFKELRSLMRVC